MSLSRAISIFEDSFAYHPVVAHYLHNVKAALLLCRLLAWDEEQKNTLSAGLVCKTAKEVYDATGLTDEEQARARKHLEKMAVVTVERHATLCYCLDRDRIEVLESELMAEYTSE